MIVINIPVYFNIVSIPYIFTTKLLINPAKPKATATITTVQLKSCGDSPKRFCNKLGAIVKYANSPARASPDILLYFKNLH